MSKSIYLINPRSKFPTYFSAEVFAACGFQPATAMADLAIPTLAAMAPPDFDVTLCDENVSTLDVDCDADFIGITGKITQWERMIRIARHFRKRGKTVIIGGPQASLSPESLRAECDVLVTGEVENIAQQLFADLKSGHWKQRYSGDKPDLDLSPLPKWDAYPNDRAAMGTVQTSRGCPFECEFCDVIQYLGRKQRHKSPSRVLAELDDLHRRGYRAVFLADDNFTVYRSRAKELLLALKHWNDRGRGVAFTTQVSIDCARDREMLELCADSGLTNVFIGIETPNESSLRETKKRQNLGTDLNERITRIVENGVAVTGGMIVGFDSDTKAIFEQQYEFAMSLPVPIFSLGALVAPTATPLHRRMALENRLVENGWEVAGSPWNTNLVPRQMSRSELIAGVRWLCNRLYHPAAFGERMLRFITEFGRDRKSAPSPQLMKPQFRPIELETLQLAARVKQLGSEEAKMLARVQRAMASKPGISQHVILMLAQYMQVRHSYDCAHLWDSRLGAQTAPSWDEPDQNAGWTSTPLRAS